MISQLVYVRCDRCGTPAGDGDDMRDDARTARARAKALGFTRVHSSRVIDVDGLRMLDICRTCRVILFGAGA